MPQLGSNDTGGSVVAMMAAFLQLAEKKQAYNLVCLESAEEENTGKNGKTENRKSFSADRAENGLRFFITI